MKQNFLIVDDQITFGEKRKVKYQKFKKLLNTKADSFTFCFDYLTDISQLPEKINMNDYDGAIVDVVLDDYWPSANIDDVIEQLGRVGIPVALVSKQWNELNSDKLNWAFKSKNAKTVLNWRDVAEEEFGESAYAIGQIIKLVCEQKGLKLEYVSHDQPINIIHMSDLQFGGFDSKQLKQEASLTADKVLNETKRGGLTFLAITGDVAEKASKSEYQAAQEWIDYFTKEIGGSNRAVHVLVVPGNHDVSIPLASSSRISLGKDGEGELTVKINQEVNDKDLLDFAYKPFADFSNEVSDPQYLTELQNELAWVESRFRHLGVIFYGVNTSTPVNPNGLPFREVAADHLAAIDQHLKKLIVDDIPQPLVIGLCHHSPISAKEDESVTNPEVFEKHFGSRIKTGVFLHGHVHKRAIVYSSESGYRLVRSCASTLNKNAKARPSDSLRGFSVLKLSRNNNDVTDLYATEYNWQGNQLKPGNSEEYIYQEDGMFKEK
jgi:hypothetical protein